MAQTTAPTAADLDRAASQAQARILDLLEELAAVSTGLREARSDIKAGNLAGASVSLGDAVESLNNLETQASEAASKLARVL